MLGRHSCISAAAADLLQSYLLPVTAAAFKSASSAPPLLFSNVCGGQHAAPWAPPAPCCRGYSHGGLPLRQGQGPPAEAELHGGGLQRPPPGGGPRDAGETRLLLLRGSRRREEAQPQGSCSSGGSLLASCLQLWFWFWSILCD